MTPMKLSKDYTILITDDDRGVRATLGEIVEGQGFRPLLASSGEEALEIVQAEPVHLALLDMQMPRLTGLETLQLVRQVNAMLPAILITAEATMELMRQAFHAHVFSVIPKPVSKNVVLTTLLRALIRVYGEPVKPAEDSPDEPTRARRTEEMTITPLNDKILVERLEAEQKTAGGIVLPDTAKEKPKQGKVLDLGEGKVLDNGKRSSFQIKKGDRVLFTSYAGTEVTVDGKEYLIMTEDDILAVVE